MNDRFTTTRIPHARPIGAPSVMEGLYKGAELSTKSSRPGAYDALAIPSLIGGRRRDHRSHTALPLPLPSAEPAIEHDAQREIAVRQVTHTFDSELRLMHSSGAVDFIPPEFAARRFTVIEVTSAFDAPDDALPPLTAPPHPAGTV